MLDMMNPSPERMAAAAARVADTNAYLSTLGRHTVDEAAAYERAFNKEN